MNILFNNLQPNTIEDYINRSDEETIFFKDSLLFGQFSTHDHYKPSQRYRFWSSIYSPLSISINRDDFIIERAHYDKVKAAFRCGEDIIIWITDDPRDILLLLTLSSIIHPNFHNGRVFLGYVTSKNKIHKRQLHEGDVREYATHWRFLTNIGTHEVSNNKNVSCFSIVMEALKYLHPFYSMEKLYLAQIDRDILDAISIEKPISEAIIISTIINCKRWIGDMYIRARIRILNEVLGILVCDNSSHDPHHIFWNKNESCLTCMNYCITDVEIVDHYISKLFLMRYPIHL
jgi:hypothetical protein